MREIKFRAYIDTFRPFGDEEKQAHMSDTFTFNDFDGDYFIPEGCYLSNMTIMQYTGLKDKNGKEIYEGDLLMFDYPMEVLFERCCFVVRKKTGNSLLLGHEIEGEIIGNIYENPELISGNAQ